MVQKTSVKKSLRIRTKIAILTIGLLTVSFGIVSLGIMVAKYDRNTTNTNISTVIESYNETIVSENQESISELDYLNQEIKTKGGAWIAEDNQFTNMTLEEKKKFTGLVLTEEEIKSIEDSNTKPENIPENIRDESLPDFFDWRNQHGENYITPVKSQGSCGSCWAFSAVATIEGEAQAYYNNPNLNIDLSEQKLVSCCSGCSSGPGCESGNPRTAFFYARMTGLVTEECFPYVADDVPCDYCDNPELFKISGYVSISHDNYSELKSALIERGPLQVSFLVYDDLYSYGEGIYQHIWGEFSGYHAVMIVGYGTYDGFDYWIVKNSWGEDWGEDGYFRIDVTDPAMHYYPTMESITSPNWDNPPEILCNDVDKDKYCNWGLGDKPANCPITCFGEIIEDCDDSNPDIFENCYGLDIDYGTLSTISIPDAEVYVKDLETEQYIYRGTTPLHHIYINPGEREIKIKKEGFLAYYESIEVESNESYYITAILEPGYECGDHITQSLVLDNDILNCDRAYYEAALKLRVDNITLDCNFHKITGLGSGMGINLYNLDDIEVKNCDISNFITGIGMWDTRRSYIKDNILKDNYRGISMGNYSADPGSTSGNYLINNNLSNNEYAGINLDQGADANFIIENYSCGNIGRDLSCSLSLVNNTGYGNEFHNTWNCEDVIFAECPSCIDSTPTFSCSNTQPQYCNANSYNDIFAVGLNGTILHYDGVFWEQVHGDISTSLYSIWGSSSDDVFAVGYDGKIMHYNKGYWAEMNSGTSASLNSIWGSSSDDVFAVGYDGTILHYNGAFWGQVTSGTNNYLSDIWGSSSTNVFTVERTEGTIRHYDGTSWSEMNGGIGIPLNSIWGDSLTDDIYIVGDFGTILHYDGTSWSEMDSGTDEHLTKIWGSSSDIYAVGYQGAILHYDGTSWSEMDSENNAHLYGVWGHTDYSTELIFNCQECGCPPGKTCNSQTGHCQKPESFPEVMEIQ